VTHADLPEALADIVEDFAAVSEPERLQLLLDFSRELPPLPERYVSHRDLMEAVAECQSPLYLAVEIVDGTVHLYFDAAPEAPTTRGFAGILRDGLEGLDVPEVLTVPDDVPHRLGLDRAVSPLRLRGMAGILARIKRQVREKSAA
jgi:cysteine desulfuration protein SufE